MFRRLLDAIQHNVINTLFKVQINVEAPARALPKSEIDPSKLQTNEANIEGNITQSALRTANSPEARVAQRMAAQAQAPAVPKAGRNDPCPCGSGKKYKKCHGA